MLHLIEIYQPYVPRMAGPREQIFEALAPVALVLLAGIGTSVPLALTGHWYYAVINAVGWAFALYTFRGLLFYASAIREESGELYISPSVMSSASMITAFGSLWITVAYAIALVTITGLG